MKRKLLTLVVLVIILFASVSYFPGHLNEYSHYIFWPLQSFRIKVLGYFPVSIGDIIYIMGGIWALVTLIKWIYFIFHFPIYRDQFALSAVSTISTLVFVYLFFLLGWGFNYDQVPLREFWSLEDVHAVRPASNDTATIKQLRMKDSLALVAFDGFLVDKLNAYAPHYKTLSFHITNERAKAYYRIYTDSKVKQNGLDVKQTLFGYFLERTAVDGYYNPFTGEGQVNTELPGFELPFVICHEMAHQAGIAAEGDANLMAYALGTLANDTSFKYSAYLNIWMYTNHRMYRRDTSVAKAFEEKLNMLTQKHIDTLDQISRKYNNTMTEYTGDIYDSYLKMQAQKDGIRSYGNVVRSAWELEEKRRDGLIRMP